MKFVKTTRDFSSDIQSVKPVYSYILFDCSLLKAAYSEEQKIPIMSIEPYGIGGTEVKTDAFEAFADIPQNRVLLADKLTYDPPVKPEIIEGLTSIDEVFEHFKPKVDMTFETEDGAMRRETLHFKGLSDFGAKGIIAQSEYLGDVSMQQLQYQKIIKQLKTNKLLKQALANPETKEHIIKALQSLIQELDSAR
jgi:hypothetical protein